MRPPDFFSPSGTLHILVSNRAKNLLHRGATNVRLERLCDALTSEIVLSAYHPDEAMKLFRVTEMHPLGRGIDARHPFGLPGVKCESCGTTWSTTGVEYPTLNAAPLADRLANLQPVSVAEFTSLANEVRAALGADLYLRPGTRFGALRGKFIRKLSHIEWLRP